MAEMLSSLHQPTSTTKPTAVVHPYIKIFIDDYHRKTTITSRGNNNNRIFSNGLFPGTVLGR
jgi:hypothetical protein